MSTPPHACPPNCTSRCTASYPAVSRSNWTSSTRPLDLLLYLLKRDELDIYDIPIARITDSYLEYVHMLREHQSPPTD